MSPFLLILTLILLVSCANTSRTQYGAFKKNEGYREQVLEEGAQLASFRGNKYTSKQDAELFAKFRAIELCHETEKKITHFMAVHDRTRSKDITRSSSNYFGPGFYHGMGMGLHPFYGRHPGFGFSAGFNTIQSNTWNETLVFPEIDVIYACEDKVYEPMLSLREVASDEMKILVKDLKGAIQVEKILPDSPNRGNVMTGDIILRVEGERVQTILELLRSLKASPSQQIAVEIFRDGERQKTIIKASDVSSAILKSQQEIIKAACSKKDIKQRSLCQGQL